MNKCSRIHAIVFVDICNDRDVKMCEDAMIDWKIRKMRQITTTINNLKCTEISLQHNYVILLWTKCAYHKAFSEILHLFKFHMICSWDHHKLRPCNSHVLVNITTHNTVQELRHMWYWQQICYKYVLNLASNLYLTNMGYIVNII